MSRTQILDPGSTDTFKYVITHVFCPLKLPDGNDHTIRNDDALAGAVATAARLYSRRVDQANFLRWHCICRMLENLQAIVQWEIIDRSQVVSQFCNMAVGGKILSLRGIVETHDARRCPCIIYPSSKCGGHLQKAGRCHYLRVIRDIPDG